MSSYLLCAHQFSYVLKARLLVSRYQRVIKTKAISEEVLEQNSNVTSGKLIPVAL